MREKLSDFAGIVGFSLFAIALFHLPDLFSGTVSAIIDYSVMSLTFPLFIWVYKLPSRKYFALPQYSFVAAIAVSLTVGLCMKAVSADGIITLPLGATLQGLLYLAVIGMGEEFVSRGFVFGILEKYGLAVAIFGSSLTFALMHLNLYLGSYWDPWAAYWHLCSTFGFGVLAAALMIATKSIWVPVILHALTDWSVVFTKHSHHTVTPTRESSAFWDGIGSGFANMSVHLAMGLILLAIVRFSASRHRGESDASQMQSL